MYTKNNNHYGEVIELVNVVVGNGDNVNIKRAFEDRKKKKTYEPAQYNITINISANSEYFGMIEKSVNDLKEYAEIEETAKDWSISNNYLLEKGLFAIKVKSSEPFKVINPDNTPYTKFTDDNLKRGTKIAIAFQPAIMEVNNQDHIGFWSNTIIVIEEPQNALEMATSNLLNKLNL